MTTLEDWWFLPKLDIFFPYNPAVVLLAIYPESEAMSKQNLHMILTRTLEIMVKIWKQSRCLLVSKCINTLWYIQTVEYHSTLERRYQAADRHARISNAYY